MIDMTNIYPSHKKHCSTLLYVRNTPYNLEKIKSKFGKSEFCDDKTTGYIEFDTKTTKWHSPFDFMFLYTNQPTISNLDDILEYDKIDIVEDKPPSYNIDKTTSKLNIIKAGFIISKRKGIEFNKDTFLVDFYSKGFPKEGDDNATKELMLIIDIKTDIEMYNVYDAYELKELTLEEYELVIGYGRAN